MRHGFSLLEVMIFVVILGLALLPVFGLGQATHRRAYFDELQQISHARAKAMLDLTSSLDFTLLAAIAAGKTGQPVPVPLDTLIGAAALQALFAPFAGTDAGLDTDRMANVKTQSSFTLLSPDLGQVISEATWSSPEHPEATHTVRLVRTVSRREGAFTHGINL